MKLFTVVLALRFWWLVLTSPFDTVTTDRNQSTVTLETTTLHTSTHNMLTATSQNAAQPTADASMVCRFGVYQCQITPLEKRLFPATSWCITTYDVTNKRWQMSFAATSKNKGFQLVDECIEKAEAMNQISSFILHKRTITPSHIDTYDDYHMVICCHSHECNLMSPPQMQKFHKQAVQFLKCSEDRLWTGTYQAPYCHDDNIRPPLQHFVCPSMRITTVLSSISTSSVTQSTSAGFVTCIIGAQSECGFGQTQPKRFAASTWCVVTYRATKRGWKMTFDAANTRSEYCVREAMIGNLTSSTALTKMTNTPSHTATYSDYELIFCCRGRDQICNTETLTRMQKNHKNLVEDLKCSENRLWNGIYQSPSCAGDTIQDQPQHIVCPTNSTTTEQSTTYLGSYNSALTFSESNTDRKWCQTIDRSEMMPEVPTNKCSVNCFNVATTYYVASIESATASDIHKHETTYELLLTNTVQQTTEEVQTPSGASYSKTVLGIIMGVFGTIFLIFLTVGAAFVAYKCYRRWTAADRQAKEAAIAAVQNNPLPTGESPTAQLAAAETTTTTVEDESAEGQRLEEEYRRNPVIFIDNVSNISTTDDDNTASVLGTVPEKL